MYMLQGNPAILNKAENATNDPALLVGMKFSIEEKAKKSFVKTNLVSHQNLFYVREKRKLENATGTVRRRYFLIKIKLGANGFHIR